jgi:UDP-N-acetylglucosamine 2-epimerase
VRVIGTDESVVKHAVLELLDDPDGLRAMASAGAGLYGDGQSAMRIVQHLSTG